MRLFLPSARATNILLIVGFLSLGYALYMRYLGIENTPVGLACGAGANTWLCFTRRIFIALYTNSVFGFVAVGAAALNLLRPSLVLFAIALSAAAFGLVLYGANLSGAAIGLLVLSLARRAPAAG